MEIESTKVDAEKLKALEDILYGTNAGAEGAPAATEPRLPLPAEVAEIIGKAAG